MVHSIFLALLHQKIESHSTKMYLARITEIEGSGGGHVCDPHNEIYHLCFLDKRRKVKKT